MRQEETRLYGSFPKGEKGVIVKGLKSQCYVTLEVGIGRYIKI